MTYSCPCCGNSDCCFTLPLPDFGTCLPLPITIPPPPDLCVPEHKGFFYSQSPKPKLVGCNNCGQVHNLSTGAPTGYDLNRWAFDRMQEHAVKYGHQREAY